MTRILAAASLVLAAAFGSAAADCEYSANGVNVCLSEQSCSGTVSVCPMADPEDCHSNVDVCLDFVGPR
jgi:hypothetical protein